MTNLHLIQAKYMGATNYTGSRLKLTSLRFGDSLTVSKDYNFGGMADQAEALLKGLGFKLVGVGYDESKGVYIFASTTFESLKDLNRAAKHLSEKQRGWHKDHYNFNKAEKWERVPAKRKTPARNVVKAAAKKKTTTKRK